MRRLAAATLLVAALSGCSTHHHAAAGRGVDTRAGAASAVLDQDAVVSRCLPQLTRHGTADGSDWTVEPLSTSSVVPAKPLVAHHDGDLVAFLGRIAGVSRPGTLTWARLDRLCRVPADGAPSRAPGSDLLPASATRPAADQRRRDLELCTEAPDVTEGPAGQDVVETQVVAPDVRDHRLSAQAWGPRGTGLMVLADPYEERGVLCSFSFSSSDAGGATVALLRPSRAVVEQAYVNGSGGEPDRYYAAGLVPSVGDAQRQPATSVAVTPPGGDTQRFPVRRTGLAGDAGVGSYAFVAAFPRVTAPLGTQHTRVQLLDRTGAVLWSGEWDVGIEGH